MDIVLNKQHNDKDDENELANLGKAKPHNFHIELVAEPFI
jgi:hypothetical protein